MSRLFCSDIKEERLFLSFFLKPNITVQNLIFQSEWFHNFNKYKCLLIFPWNNYYELV